MYFYEYKIHVVSNASTKPISVINLITEVFCISTPQNGIIPSFSIFSIRYNPAILL